MPAPKLRWDYDELMQIAQRFGHESQAAGKTLKRVQSNMQDLEGGDWIGKGAKAFYKEMDQEVLPSLRRLTDALATAQQVTVQMVRILQGAEADAARLLSVLLAGLSTDGRAVASAVGTAWGHVSDFFIGMWDEGKDMVTGLVNLVTDPIGTAKGLWHGITHPGELWAAFKEPYVEAWESGHPGQAIGRGVMFVGSMLLGTKGADKLSKAAKAARASRITADAAEVGARMGSALSAADEIGLAARGSRAETALARYIASESTHTFGAVDRVVIGGFKPNPARGFLGYIDEAATHGGTVFNTGDDVWRIADAAGSNRGWAINREFMQAQLERGAPRFELAGESVSEVLSGRRALSGTANEVRFLQRYGYEYGYRQVGDSWIRMGDWRASTAGRVAGSSVGPGLDVIEDASR